MKKIWLPSWTVITLVLTGCYVFRAVPSPAPTIAATEEPSRTPTVMPTPTATPEAVRLTCDKTMLFQVGHIVVWALRDSGAFFFQAGMTIDADGAPDAYHPDDIGKDYLANGGQPGNWWALVTDEDGEPVVQGPHDPEPGYYVSNTELEDTTRPVTDPQRYVDSNEIPFVVLPFDQRGGAQLGDFAVVVNRANGARSYAIFADLGPSNYLGEGSIALAEALGVAPSLKHGGTDGGLVYVVFPNSGSGRPRSTADTNSISEKLFETWGGMDRIEACFRPASG